MKRRGFFASLLGALGFAAFYEKPKQKTMQDVLNEHPEIAERLFRDSPTRNESIANYIRYRAGESLEEIATNNGVSIDRVRRGVAMGEHYHFTKMRVDIRQLKRRTA